ncbi:MAG: DUF1573 domain-containing protein [Bacteroidota bacterium]
MNLLFLFCLLILPYPPVDTSGPAVEWLTPLEQDLGDLIRKEPVTVEFHYKNAGDVPLVIDNVRTSCGCAAPDWSYEPVAPDSTGLISIRYDAKKSGYFRKKIKVFFNGIRKAQVIWMEGWVEEVD